MTLLDIKNAPATVPPDPLILNAEGEEELVIEPVPAEPAPPPDEVAALNETAGRVDWE